MKMNAGTVFDTTCSGGKIKKLFFFFLWHFLDNSPGVSYLSPKVLCRVF